MARNKGAKGQESRARLLAAAAEQFAGLGFYETKISSIVAQAGLTQPSFYLYFESKEAVFEELVSHFRSRLQELVTSSRLESGLQPGEVNERVLGVLETLFRFFTEDPHLTRIGLFQAPEAGSIKAELAALIRDNLLEEQRSGYFRSTLDMDVVAQCFVGTLERLTFAYLSEGAGNPEQLAAQVVELFMRGMLPEE
ncbi:TetR/AcrR family transcriptional regulator [Paenibacillus elgii]|uniref:TetR/AcrR family transcriptional regulator n=1 Tax=Paenibacillus elgii TaxID=189691 RepID=UPI002040E3B4|nr:TetR/AcrR family transcriptional regulator [Paenibacillus elgii]MCM3273497.1 TetR/AcrR family transcriptional regulator [Paenibacillus elgii]